MSAGRIAALVLSFLVAGAEMAAGFSAQGAPPPSGSGGALPADVYPDTQMRLPSVKREALDDYGKQVYDRFVDPDNPSAVIRGPNSIRLYSPLVADHYYTVNQYLRTLPGQGVRLAELAILNAAREINSAYEWSAHESAAQRAGLEQGIIDLVKFRKELPAAGVVAGLGEKESVIIRLARAMFREKVVNAALFAEARRLFGDKGLVELVSLIAHYSATGVLLNTFGNVPAPSPNSPLPLP
jgi:4-carboxymuconolactone decarboxylase